MSNLLSRRLLIGLAALVVIGCTPTNVPGGQTVATTSVETSADRETRVSDLRTTLIEVKGTLTAAPAPVASLTPAFRPPTGSPPPQHAQAASSLVPSPTPIPSVTCPIRGWTVLKPSIDGTTVYVVVSVIVGYAPPPVTLDGRKPEETGSGVSPFSWRFTFHDVSNGHHRIHASDGCNTLDQVIEVGAATPPTTAPPAKVPAPPTPLLVPIPNVPGPPPPPIAAPVPTGTVTPPSGAVRAVVVRVVDGDEVDVLLDDKQYRVRYLGIDASEYVDPNRHSAPYGPEAAVANTLLLTGKTVYLERDASDADQYGRLLRYVWLDGALVNELMVSHGYAEVATVPPDVKYADRLLRAQERARAAGAGLWGLSPSTSPSAGPTRMPMVTPTRIAPATQ